MTDGLAEWAARAEASSPEERARLAEELLASSDPRLADVEDARADDSRRRLDEVERGEIERVPGKDAFARLKRASRR